MLGNLGEFFAREVLGDQLAGFSLNHDKFVGRKYFDEQDRLLFEERIKGTEKAVAREGLAEGEVWWRDRLQKSLWDRLPVPVRISLANSEYSYSRNKDLKGFDFAHASIGLSKAIELWLNEEFVRPLAESSSRLAQFKQRPSTARENLTLGEIRKFLRECRDILAAGSEQRRSILDRFPALEKEDLEALIDDVRTIGDEFRNGWVHTRLMPREKFESFREFGPRFFMRWKTLLARG